MSIATGVGMQYASQRNNRKSNETEAKILRLTILQVVIMDKRGRSNDLCAKSNILSKLNDAISCVEFETAALMSRLFPAFIRP